MADETRRTSMKPITITKRFRFNEDSMEPTDAEFNELFDQYNSTSAWFVLILILSCLPYFCIMCERGAFKVAQTKEGYCVFPDLLSNNWTFIMTNNLTSPEYGGPCTYHKFDFEEIKDMTFTEAIEMKRNMESLPDVGICAMPVEPKTHNWNTSNFLKSCTSYMYKQKAAYFRELGAAISQFVMGIIGDLYGRKFGIWICFPVYVAAMILYPLARHFYILCAACFCGGFGSAGLLFLSYIITIEICNPDTRGIFSFYVIGVGIAGDACAYFINLSNYAYPISTILCSMPSLSLVLYLVYVPESPRWQLSYGRKRRAWRTLDSVGANTSGQIYLPRISLSKGKILYDNLQILFYTSRYLRALLIISLAIFVKDVIYLEKGAYVQVERLKLTSHRIILLVGEMFSFFNVLPPFIIFGRYWSIMGIYGSSVVYLFITMFCSNMTSVFILNTLTAVTVSSLEFLFLLYFCELVPTCTRATAVGLMFVFVKAGKFVLQAFMFLCNLERISRNYVMCVLSVCCLVALLFLPNVNIRQLPDYKRSRTVVEI